MSDEPKKLPRLKLFTEVEDGKLKNAITKVTWCITDSFNEELDKTSIPNLHVVLIVEADRREINRKVAPLEQGSMYIDFHRGGENTIHAFLVYGMSERKVLRAIKHIDVWTNYAATEYSINGELITVHSNEELESIPVVKQFREDDQAYRDSAQAYSQKLAELREPIETKWYDLQEEVGGDALYRDDLDLYDDELELTEEQIKLRDELAEEFNSDNVLTPEEFGVLEAPTKPYYSCGYVAGIDVNELDRNYNNGVATLSAQAQTTVYVDEELFAKEPNKKLLYFVNLWHEASLDDQCHYRRRVIFLFTLKWIPILLWTIVKSGAMFASSLFFVSIGFKPNKVNWLQCLHPWEFPLNSPFFNLEVSDQYLVDTNQDNPVKAFGKLLALPLYWLGVAPLATAFMYLKYPEEGFVSLYGTAVISTALLVLGIGAVIGTLVGINWVWNNHLSQIAWVDKITAPVRKLFGYIDREMTPEELAEYIERQNEWRNKMVCPADESPYEGNEPFSWSNWFNKIKSQVCKPFPK